MAKPPGSGNNMKNKICLYGITPVHQALLHSHRDCHELLIKAGSKSPRIKDILKAARQKKVPVKEVDAHLLGNLSGTKMHQGVVLKCGELKTYELDELLEKIRSKEKKFIVALDQIEDPHNLGAIARTSAFFGADAILTLKSKTAPLTPTASKSSAGALEYLPIIQVPNLSEALQELSREAFQIIGASSDDALDFREIHQTDYQVLVMGNEGQGLRKLTQKRCDVQAFIPGNCSTESLNVSVAAAILIQHFIQN
jgi:23S rRNA (guanosine2251-2'-O)-methyltransferase